MLECFWETMLSRIPFLQVTKSAKQQQQRKAQSQPAFEDQAAASDAPRKWHDYNVHFEFPPAASAASSGNLITLNDVGFQYPGRDDFGLSKLDIGIDMGSRIAIVGPNGAGKSTLMNLLAGETLSGRCSLQSSTDIHKFSGREVMRFHAAEKRMFHASAAH